MVEATSGWNDFCCPAMEPVGIWTRDPAVKELSSLRWPGASKGGKALAISKILFPFGFSASQGWPIRLEHLLLNERYSVIWFVDLDLVPDLYDGLPH